MSTLTGQSKTASPLRVLAKVGTREREWLIVNEHGGLVREFTGSKRMSACLEFIHSKCAGEIHRHPGGFWRAKDTWNGDSFGTSTIEALVARGLLQYSQWQEGRNGRFPIAAKIV